MGAYSEAIKEGAKPQTKQANATTSATTVNTVPGTKAFRLFNRSTTKALLYSVDGGTTYFQVPPFSEVDENVDMTSILIKSASGTADYDLKVALRQ